MMPEIMQWEKLSRYIYRSDALVIDLRDREAYQKGHVTGAWNIPYEELEEHWKEVRGYDIVILYCDHGNHSLTAARRLAKEGIQTFSMAGGYEMR